MATERAPDEQWIDFVDLDEIQLAELNPKNHDRAGINESMSRHGAVMPPALNEATGRLFAGHGRVLTLRERKARGEAAPRRVRVDGERWLIPVLRGTSFPTDDEALEYLLVDNKLSEAGGWVRQAYEDIVHALEQRGRKLEAVGFSRSELDDIAAAIEARGKPAMPVPSLRDRFLVPPFSVLDARQGYWKDRKAAWLATGIRSEIGRGDTASTSARSAPGEKPSYRQIGSGPAFPKSGAVMAPGQGGGMADNLVAARAGSKRRGTNRAPMAASFGQDLMRGKSDIPSDGLGPGTRRKKATARTFDTGAALGAGNFNDQVVGKRRGKADAIPGGAGANAAYRKGGAKARAITDHEWVRERQAEGELGDGLASSQTGTSIFDPVLCELSYRWFCPKGGLVLDPFAGGSVRGIVAALLERRYIGIDLRPEQVHANELQAKTICKRAKQRPRWIVGDGKDLASLVPAKQRQADLVFSCPPYLDLERYSDDERDLSTMTLDAFVRIYGAIIKASVDSLRDNRFAVFVTGDVRAPDGTYRDLPGITADAFRAAGAKPYNNAILVTSIGSLPIRVGKQFVTSRKLGTTHQYVQIFCKGDPKKATEACGKIEVDFPAELLQRGTEA